MNLSSFHRKPPASRYRRGLAAVEFALTLPFLVIIIMGTIDFGRFGNALFSTENAARCGAYYGSTSSLAAADQAAIRNAAVQDLQTVHDVSLTNITVTSTIADDAENQKFISVTVSVPFRTLFGFPTTGVMLSGKCQMRIRPDQR